jgi:multiple sugar transport system substrate-binding protein
MRKVIGVSILLIGLWSWSLAQQHLEWHDDGSVTLITFEDNERITLSAEQLGTLFGPGQQPFAGKRIAITVNNSGPKGGISGPLYRLRPAWQELTGATLSIVEMPLAEQLPTTINDLRLGLGQFDGFIQGAWYMGEYVTPGFIIPVDNFIADPRFPQWNPDWWPPSLREIHTWGDQIYGTLNDSDGQVLYWRNDILSDPEWRARYQAEVGSPMPFPIQTWDDVIAIARFFNGKNWDNTDPDPDSGIVMHFRVNEQGMFHYMSMSAAYVVRPGDTVDRCTNNYWFDPATMEPLINSEGHVRALERLVELSNYGPRAQVGWDLGTAWDWFLRGKAIFVFSWGDVGALVQDEARSQIKGKLGASVLPGSMEAYNMCTNTWETLTEPNVVGNTIGGSWHGVISAKSPNPEVVYSLYALMATEPVSLWNVNRGWTGVDPGISIHFLPPQGTASIEGYLEEGWNESDLKFYLDAYYNNFFAETMLTYLRINGTEEYWRALDQNLSEAMVGRLSPREALDRTARAWDEITNRRGLDLQLRQYQEAIGYTP